MVEMHSQREKGLSTNLGTASQVWKPALRFIVATHDLKIIQAPHEPLPSQGREGKFQISFYMARPGDLLVL
jgi:hypothetical protein